MMKHSFRSSFWDKAFGVALVFFISTGAVAEEMGLTLACDKNQIAELADEKAACLVSAFSAFQALKNPGTVLIDIRAQQSYQKVSIPYSINIPAYALKRKQIFKKQKLYLIDDGGEINDSHEICWQFLRLGYDVSLIEGGLNAWQKVDNNFIGLAGDIQKIDELGPQHLLFKNIPNDWLFLNIGDQKNSITSRLGLPENSSLYMHFNIRTEPIVVLLKRIKLTLKQNPKVSRIFIYDADGTSYAQLKKVLKNNLKPSVFYLDGGYQALQQFYAMQSSLKQKKQSHSPSFPSCRG